MVRPIPAAMALLALMFVASCTTPMQRSATRSPASETVAGPDCRAHCERGYRVCMDSAASRRGSDDDGRRDRLFGTSANCEAQLRSCFPGCATQ